MSYVIPRRRRSSTISALFRSTNSRGGTPSLSASYVIGVPCSSVPLAISTREPRSRSNRAMTSAGTAKPATWPMWRGPLAYGHGGATRTVLLFSDTGDHKGKLAARRVVQHGQHLGRSAAQQLLVDLRQLASHGELTLGHDVRDDRERLPDAIWRLESHRRTRIGSQRRQQAPHLARLAGQVTEKREARTAVARGGQRRCDRARPGDGHHCVPRRPRCSV